MSIFNKGTLNPSAPNPPLSGGRLHGIDVYHEDDVTSWAAIAQSNSFAICKTSEGSSPDSKFLQYAAGGKSAGLKVGGYHFMHYGAGSGAAQAQLAVSMINQAGVRMLACDWEYTDGHTPTSSEIAVVQDFLKTAESLMGKKPWIYCSNYLPGSIGNPSWFSAYPLWVARYGANPTVATWDIWQYGESSSVSGVGNPCDVNYFNGTQAELETLFG